MRNIMFKISISPKAYLKIDMYVLKYREYFEELFQDSGIWEEQKIIHNYQLDSEERYFQILDTLESTLSNPLISYQNNTTIIRWRSKILLVSFRDK
jgi:hypothetical protein